MALPCMFEGFGGVPNMLMDNFKATNPHSLSVYPNLYVDLFPRVYHFYCLPLGPLFGTKDPVACALPNTSAGKESTMSMMVARLHPIWEGKTASCEQWGLATVNILLMVQKSQSCTTVWKYPKTL